MEHIWIYGSLRAHDLCLAKLPPKMATNVNTVVITSYISTDLVAVLSTP